ncbi:MAG TPA: flagellar motor protein MotB [Pirellulales bacterium]
MAGKGGGAWKVAYADFVTAMMAFFLVMWITAQSNSMKQAVAKYFQHPFDAAGVRTPILSKSSSGSSLVPTHRDLEGSSPKGNGKGRSPKGGGMISDEQPPADPSQVPKSGGIRKRVGFSLRNDPQSGMGNEVIFAANSAELDHHAQQSLDELLRVFLGKRNKIEIRGHTPNVQVAALPVDSGSTNSGNSATDAAAPAVPDIWRLSYDRCLSVMKYLEAHGIEPQRIRLSQAGAYEPPPATEVDPNNASPDSRVEIYMLPEYVDDYLSAKAKPAEEKPTQETPAEQTKN